MRWIFWASTAVLGGVVLTGLSRNAGNKFVRTLPQQGCLSNYANVADSRGGQLLPPELVCCSGRPQDEDVCVGRRNPTAKVITSNWAFVIPLAALAVNALCDWLAGGVTAARTRARRNRFLLYSAIILVRTLVLYRGFGYVQELVQAEESSNCWYAHLRRRGRCSEHFDFADHVVLGVCQYFAIQVLELSCIVEEYRDFWRASASASAPSSSLPLPRKPSPTPSSSSSSSSSGSMSRSPSPPPPSVFLSVLPATAVCVAVAGAALLLVYGTAAFFHSRAETAVALAISWFVVGSPLSSLMGAGARGGMDGGGGGARGLGRGGRAGTNGGLSRCRGVFLAPYPSAD